MNSRQSAIGRALDEAKATAAARRRETRQRQLQRTNDADAVNAAANQRRARQTSTSSSSSASSSSALRADQRAKVGLTLKPPVQAPIEASLCWGGGRERAATPARSQVGQSSRSLSGGDQLEADLLLGGEGKASTERR